MRKKIQNFWYYYKAAVIIALVIVAAGAWLLVQQKKAERPDYEAALVSPEYYSEEQIESLKDALQKAGADSNGDGKVSVNLKVYRIALGEEGQDANVIGALDADLVGKVSGLFLLSDPVKFEEVTNGICRAADAVPAAECEALRGLGFDGLSLAVREGADEKYAVMLKELTA